MAHAHQNSSKKQMDGGVEKREKNMRGDVLPAVSCSYHWQILQDLDPVSRAHMNHMVEVCWV